MSQFDRDFRLTKDILPSRYELRFDLDLDSWTAKGWERITLRTATPTREIVLHSVELDIATASVDGTNALAGQRAEDEAQVVVLRFAKDIPAGQHTLDIEWTGGIRDSPRGLYRSVRGEERYAATQFEAADARRAFPCFDEPGFKTPYAVSLTVSAGQQAISNGPELAPPPGSAPQTGPTRSVAFAETPPLPTYLVAFAAGEFDLVEAPVPPNAVRTTKLPLRGVAVRGVPRISGQAV